MKITFKAEFVTSRPDGTVTLDFPTIKPVTFGDWPKIEMVDPETGARRPMTMSETRDFEEALDRFVNLRTAKALAAEIDYTEP